jgi:hypothetical protein
MTIRQSERLTGFKGRFSLLDLRILARASRKISNLDSKAAKKYDFGREARRWLREELS